MHLRTQAETHSHVKWKERTQPQTCTHNYMHVCIHTHPRIQIEMSAYAAAYKTRQRCLFLIKRHTCIHTHTRVLKYRSGMAGWLARHPPLILSVSVSQVSVIQEMDSSWDSTPGFLSPRSDVSQSVKAWPKSFNPKWLRAFSPPFPTNWLKDGKCLWDNCLFFPIMPTQNKSCDFQKPLI